MTAFERYLIDKGYLKFILNRKTSKFELAGNLGLSTLRNLDYTYIYKDDKPFLNMIENGLSVMDESFTHEIRKGEIVFGLRQVGYPPTLIYPKPCVILKRMKNEQEEWITQDFDEVMSCALDIIPFDDIFEAMYDKTIRFEIDAKQHGKPTYKKVIYSKANK